MKQTSLVILFILGLLVSVVVSLQFIFPASANPDGLNPALSMPIEHINYTITHINGTLWAKIEGDYPIYVQDQSDCSLERDLPMVYPMPPGTINIHVWLEDREIGWSNYTQSNPDALHHTAIGDWWMIHSILRNISDFFVLKIRYEHPLEVVNGSYLFLYDLNISPYLSQEAPDSTAYFTVHMEANVTNVHAYTALPDSPASNWKPMSYTSIAEDGIETVSIIMQSAYDAPLVGDLVVKFSDTEGVPEFQLWVISVLLATVSAVYFLMLRRKIKTQHPQSRNSQT